MFLLGSRPESLALLGVEYVSQRMWREGFLLDLGMRFMWFFGQKGSKLEKLSGKAMSISFGDSLELALKSEQT